MASETSLQIQPIYSTQFCESQSQGRRAVLRNCYCHSCSKCPVSRGFSGNSTCPSSAFVGVWFGGSMRVPFASFATHKLMARALSHSENECGGGIVLARPNCALRVAGSGYLRLPHVAGL